MLSTLFCVHKSADEVWDPLIETCEFGAKHAVLYAQNRRWGLGPIETFYSGGKHADLQAQIHRWGLGPIVTRNSGTKHGVLHAQNHRWGLGPIDTWNLGHKGAVFHAQNHRCGLGSVIFFNSIKMCSVQLISGFIYCRYSRRFCTTMTQVVPNNSIQYKHTL